MNSSFMKGILGFVRVMDGELGFLTKSKSNSFRHMASSLTMDEDHSFVFPGWHFVNPFHCFQYIKVKTQVLSAKNALKTKDGQTLNVDTSVSFWFHKSCPPVESGPSQDLASDVDMVLGDYVESRNRDEIPDQIDLHDETKALLGGVMSRLERDVQQRILTAQVEVLYGDWNKKLD